MRGFARARAARTCEPNSGAVLSKRAPKYEEEKVPKPRSKERGAESPVLRRRGSIRTRAFIMDTPERTEDTMAFNPITEDEIEESAPPSSERRHGALQLRS